MVDGLLEPYYGGLAATGIGFVDIGTDTGSNVISGKFAKACGITDPTCVDAGGNPDGGLSRHVGGYNTFVSQGVKIVRTAADLSCKRVNDNLPEFVFYQQKLWGIDIPAGATPEQREALAQQRAAEWMQYGLRIAQLEYSPTDNEGLYRNGDHFSGLQTGIDNGHTDIGESVARFLLDHGAILDVSHSRNSTVNDTLALAGLYAARRNRAVPVLANHANIDGSDTIGSPWTTKDPLDYSAERNKTLDEMCRVAASGGTVGVMPVAGFLPPGASFLTLIDEIRDIKNFPCPNLDWKGDPINMIDHISVATDSVVDYIASGSAHYVDVYAALPDRWRWLASQMLDLTDQFPAVYDFDLEDLRKIFGANQLRALRAGLEGQLPFEPDLCSVNPSQVFTGDFNGDGRDDLLLNSSAGETLVDYAERGGELDGTDWKRASAAEDWCAIDQNRQLYIGDFNGDGRDDLFCHESDGDSWIDYADENGQFLGTDWSRQVDSDYQNWCTTSSTLELHIGDFNGDGRDDLLCQGSNGGTWIDYAAPNGDFDGTDWSRDVHSNDKSWCSIGPTRKLHIGDFNGDGRDDLLCHQNNGNSWIDYANWVGGFNGTNWDRNSAQVPYWCLVGTNLSLTVADANGDGRDDLICHDRDDGRLFLDMASTSGSFDVTERMSEGGFCMLPTQKLLAGDVNGDGTGDLLCYESNDGWLTMSLAENNEYIYELDEAGPEVVVPLPIAGSFSVTNDWGTGYCVTLDVTNTYSEPTVDWAASFVLNGTTIYDIWNLDLTLNGDAAAVTPVGEWSQVFEPGESSHSLGFCANRSSGSALPAPPVVIGLFE